MIIYKVDSRAKTTTNNNKGHFIMTKEPNQEEETKILNT